MTDKITDVNEVGKPAHDEGPWSYYRDSDYWSIESLEATICGGKDNMEGNEANYFLLASAPELLEALSRMIEPYSGWSDEELARRVDVPTFDRITRAQVAIAKALGQ